MNCIKCGELNLDGAAFCGNCGNGLATAQAISPSVSSAPVERAETNDAVQQVLSFAVKSLAEGKSRVTIVNDLVTNGVSEDAANTLVDQAENLKKEVFRKHGLKEIGIGVGLLALGGVITALTYSAASGGGKYVVTTGLFLVGAIKILRGLWRTISG